MSLSLYFYKITNVRCGKTWALVILSLSFRFQARAKNINRKKVANRLLRPQKGENGLNSNKHSQNSNWLSLSDAPTDVTLF